ncbi:Calcium load-activated calcium channel [Geodia barretti]|uniref:Calcium load-activated calcium channel n=1 Tax=Geodia barretti TaxID=519541 RepID=A0AA35T0G4_GEOBA|nr:Calcium load-activated calcium channel [Geodia barretti]
MLEDSLLIVFVSFCTAFLSEGILYLLVYRTEHYNRLKTEVERRSKKLERQRENYQPGQQPGQKKKLGIVRRLLHS